MVSLFTVRAAALVGIWAFAIAVNAQVVVVIGGLTFTSTVTPTTITPTTSTATSDIGTTTSTGLSTTDTLGISSSSTDTSSPSTSDIGTTTSTGLFTTDTLGISSSGTDTSGATTSATDTSGSSATDTSGSGSSATGTSATDTSGATTSATDTSGSGSSATDTSGSSATDTSGSGSSATGTSGTGSYSTGISTTGTGTITTASTASGSSSSSSASAASSSVTITGTTNLPGVEFFFFISQDGGRASLNTKRGLGAPDMLSKRQATGGFIGAAGPVNPASCSDATLFNLTNGQLTSGGEAVATDPGVAYIELRVMPAGTISTTFSISGGVLHWFNAAFTNGQATFCQVPTGQVYAVFVPLANGPVGCTQVSLLAFSAVQCQNGAVVPVPSSSVASGPGTVTVTQPSGVGPTAVVTATVIGSNNLPQHQNIFPVAASPAGESCVPITLSWVPGVMPTFIGLP